MYFYCKEIFKKAHNTNDDAGRLSKVQLRSQTTNDFEHSERISEKKVLWERDKKQSTG